MKFIFAFFVSLFISVFFVTERGLEMILSNLEEKIKVAVFIDPSERSPEVIFEKIRNLENIRDIEFRSSREVFLKMKTDPQLSRFLPMIDKNPFPHTIVITPDKLKHLTGLIEKIKNIENIEEVAYDTQALKFFLDIKKYVDFATIIVYIFSLLLLLVIIQTIYNMIIHKKSMRWADLLISFLGGLCGTLTVFMLCEIMLKFFSLSVVHFIISITISTICGVMLAILST